MDGTLDGKLIDKRLPWSLPHWQPGNKQSYFKPNGVVNITLNMAWMSLIRPGDVVNLVDALTMQIHCYGSVGYMKHTHLGLITPQELNLWSENATHQDLYKTLGEVFRISLGDNSIGLVLYLTECNQ